MSLVDPLLQGFCDANWGSQIGSAVDDGVEIEMFKYRSMSGFLIMRCGGPIAWKAVRQPRTSRSPCKPKSAPRTRLSRKSSLSDTGVMT